MKLKKILSFPYVYTCVYEKQPLCKTYYSNPFDASCIYILSHWRSFAVNINNSCTQTLNKILLKVIAMQGWSQQSQAKPWLGVGRGTEVWCWGHSPQETRCVSWQISLIDAVASTILTMIFKNFPIWPGCSYVLYSFVIRTS